MREREEIMKNKGVKINLHIYKSYLKIDGWYLRLKGFQVILGLFVIAILYSFVCCFKINMQCLCKQEDIIILIPMDW